MIETTIGSNSIRFMAVGVVFGGAWPDKMEEREGGRRWMVNTEFDYL